MPNCKKLYFARFTVDGVQQTIEQVTFSKLHLRDKLADQYHIPKNSIKVINPAKESFDD